MKAKNVCTIRFFIVIVSNFVPIILMSDSFNPF